MPENLSVALPPETINAVVAYLITRPYAEVYELLDALKRDARQVTVQVQDDGGAA